MQEPTILEYCPLCPIRWHMRTNLPPRTRISDFIIGDGNCGFRAFANGLFGDQSYHNLIRNAACRTIAENGESFAGIPGGFNSSGTEQTFNQTVDEYLNDKQRLASNALDVECYCDLPLLQAAAIAYRQPVNLYSRNDNNAFDVFYDLHELRPTNALAETEPITLVHFGAHYEVLVPAADEESQNENQAVCFF